MSSLNKVQLIGRLGQDPEVKYLPNGDAVCNISLATSETWKDKQTGERKEKTEWHRVVLFGKVAEIAGQYLKKGALAYFEGKLETRKWQDQQGQDRYTTEIRASEMKMLGGKDDSSAGSREGNTGGQQQRPATRNASAPQPQRQPLPENDKFDDDVPF